MRTITGRLAAVALLLGLSALPATAQDGTPLFRFHAFSADDLEIAPGANMNLHGAISTNGDLYLNAENTLTVGDGPGVPLARVTAGGRIYRGRKNTTECRGTVRVDALRDVLDPLGALDPVTVPCSAAASRVMLPPAFIAAFDGSVADESPLGPLPSRDLIERGDASWQMADLRLALDLASPINGLYPIVALDAEGSLDEARTTRLHAFMTAKPGRIFYNDVPRSDRRSTGACTGTIASTTYCSLNAYAVPFPTQADVYPCAQTDLNLYPSCPRYMTNIDYGTSGARTARRGGFYDNREHDWVYMLSVNPASRIRPA